MVKALSEYAADWQRNAERDPLCAILSFPEYRDRAWRLDDFFRTGEDEVRTVFAALNRCGVSFRTGSFLDFGCGAGRISRALRRRFDEGLGLDIAPAMVALAAEHVPDVTFLVNPHPDLRDTPDARFDLVYSHMTLQHLPAALQERYIREFARVLAPGGLCVFQVITEILFEDEAKRRRFYAREAVRRSPIVRWIERLRPPRRLSMELHEFGHDRVVDCLRDLDCRLEAEFASNSCEAALRDGLRLDDDVEARRRALDARPGKTYFSRMYAARRCRGSGST